MFQSVWIARIRNLTVLWVMSLCTASCSDSDAAEAPDSESPGNAAEGVSWEHDIAPLVNEKCTRCHQDQGIAPFSMEQYASAKPWASAMADAVAQGRMPPFLAQDTDDCRPRLPWYEDLRLSDAQKTLLRTWAKAGAPEGRAARGAKRLETPRPSALDREDIVMRLPEPITVEGNRDIHTCIVVDPELDEDTYITGRMITAGNARVLHHVVSYVVQPGKLPDGTLRTKAQLEAAVQELKGVGIGGRYDCFGGADLPGLEITMLDGWAPGALPNIAPRGSAQLIAKDALVLLDVHYHPTGEPETDTDTKLSLMVADERPSMISQVILLGNFDTERRVYERGIAELIKQPGEQLAEFVIPAGADGHVEEMTWTFTVPATELRVYAAGTHMHYVGRDMRIRLEHTAMESDDREECLIETPQWDFNWQRGYGYDAAYEELPVITTGDKLHLRCVYENTMQNRFVAQALRDQGMDTPVEVRLGEDTLDEMCVAALGVIYPNRN